MKYFNYLSIFFFIYYFELVEVHICLILVNYFHRFKEHFKQKNLFLVINQQYAFLHLHFKRLFPNYLYKNFRHSKIFLHSHVLNYQNSFLCNNFRFRRKIRRNRIFCHCCTNPYTHQNFQNLLIFSISHYHV